MTYYPEFCWVVWYVDYLLSDTVLSRRGCWKMDVEGKEKFPRRVEGDFYARGKRNQMVL